VLGLDFSPIKGPKGNIEYLLYVKNDNCTSDTNADNINEVVSLAHEEAK